MTALEYRIWMGTEVGTALGGLTEVALCARYLQRPVTVVSLDLIRTLHPATGEIQGWGPTSSIVVVHDGVNHYMATRLLS